MAAPRDGRLLRIRYEECERFETDSQIRTE